MRRRSAGGTIVCGALSERPGDRGQCGRAAAQAQHSQSPQSQRRRFRTMETDHAMLRERFTTEMKEAMKAGDKASSPPCG